MTFLVSFIFSLGILAALPYSAIAQEEAVLINEIAWMGTSVVGVEEKQWWRYEWIELYNAGDTVGMLDGWTLELYRDKLDFTVSLKGTIVPNGYYVTGASDKISNLDLNYKNLGGKFFNGGQRVVLKNNLGEIIDELDARNGWPAGDNKTKQTMERVGGSDPPTLWQTSKDLGGTPKARNSEGVASQTKSDLVLKESQTKFGLVHDETEKDLLQSFQSRVPVVNPITLLAGFLALGFSGVLLLVKRSLASRQARLPERQERQKS